MLTTALDAEFVFDRFLGGTNVLEVVGSVLARKAPKWSNGLHIRKTSTVRVSVDIGESGALSKAVLKAAAERGPTYQALVSQDGKGEERLFGSVELRGNTTEMVVVVAVDEKPFAHIAGRLLSGNHIAVQIRKSKIEGVDAAAWLNEFFIELCQKTAPVWGSVRDDKEYWEKVMAESPVVSAIGRDFGKYLPGIFWMNFFGKPYVDLIGKDRLASTPSLTVSEVNEGFCIKLYEDPSMWSELHGRKSEERALHHLGSKYFFKKENQTRKTVSPNWE